MFAQPATQFTLFCVVCIYSISQYLHCKIFILSNVPVKFFKLMPLEQIYTGSYLKENVTTLYLV